MGDTQSAPHPVDYRDSQYATERVFPLRESRDQEQARDIAHLRLLAAAGIPFKHNPTYRSLTNDTSSQWTDRRPSHRARRTSFSSDGPRGTTLTELNQKERESLLRSRLQRQAEAHGGPSKREKNRPVSVESKGRQQQKRQISIASDTTNATQHPLEWATPVIPLGAKDRAGRSVTFLPPRPLLRSASPLSNTEVTPVGPFDSDAGGSFVQDKRASSPDSAVKDNASDGGLRAFLRKLSTSLASSVDSSSGAGSADPQGRRFEAFAFAELGAESQMERLTAAEAADAVPRGRGSRNSAFRVPSSTSYRHASLHAWDVFQADTATGVFSALCMRKPLKARSGKFQIVQMKFLEADWVAVRPLPASLDPQAPLSDEELLRRLTLGLVALRNRKLQCRLRGPGALRGQAGDEGGASIGFRHLDVASPAALPVWTLAIQETRSKCLWACAWVPSGFNLETALWEEGLLEGGEGRVRKQSSGGSVPLPLLFGSSGSALGVSGTGSVASGARDAGENGGAYLDSSAAAAAFARRKKERETEARAERDSRRGSGGNDVESSYGGTMRELAGPVPWIEDMDLLSFCKGGRGERGLHGRRQVSPLGFQGSGSSLFLSAGSGMSSNDHVRRRSLSISSTSAGGDGGRRINEGEPTEGGAVFCAYPLVRDTEGAPKSMAKRASAFARSLSEELGHYVNVFFWGRQIAERVRSERRTARQRAERKKEARLAEEKGEAGVMVRMEENGLRRASWESGFGIVSSDGVAVSLPGSEARVQRDGRGAEGERESLLSSDVRRLGSLGSDGGVLHVSGGSSVVGRERGRPAAALFRSLSSASLGSGPSLVTPSSSRNWEGSLGRGRPRFRSLSVSAAADRRREEARESRSKEWIRRANETYAPRSFPHLHRAALRREAGGGALFIQGSMHVSEEEKKGGPVNDRMLHPVFEKL
uniref:Uncharacterized protein n=1 Tax=Chromera velia CCMP2878 TaxID=1169474 RepID=A0A0K6S794_9ALVE|eukprot:Cvel_4170.t1-p1 / transcript=Cvel_4170.t1 / gene=Cvel_4170 / organism=Chromera_velia_CCMP2878 / gene_product=hypothetical protein / transcript_product=hypothetical protein / location=Cvel_scaffold179:86123-92144(+) / protein_length=934 / sequence_SO=supercontig / SO=protein_coding / is_pseudo=false